MQEKKKKVISTNKLHIISCDLIQYFFDENFREKKNVSKLHKQLQKFFFLSFHIRNNKPIVLAKINLQFDLDGSTFLT